MNTVVSRSQLAAEPLALYGHSEELSDQESACRALTVKADFSLSSPPGDCGPLRMTELEKTLRVYFNLAPIGTSSRKLASTGFPPSIDAATIMPFDSNPRNLRGARFATMTIFRPISVSGA
jgi:hypothetical protein